MEYITLEKLKNFLQISDNMDNAVLESIIKNVTAMIDLSLGDNIGEKEITRRVDGLGRDFLVMENKIQSVKSVKIAKTGENVKVTEIDGCMVYLEGCVPNGKRNIEITYARGYRDIPDDIEIIALEYARKIWQKNFLQNPENLTKIEKSKKIGDLQITYFSPSELSGDDTIFAKNFEKIVQKYKNFSLVY